MTGVPRATMRVSCSFLPLVFFAAAAVSPAAAGSGGCWLEVNGQLFALQLVAGAVGSAADAR